MIRYSLVTLSALLLLLAPPAPAATIEGVEFADRLEAGEQTLQLNGTGLLRYRILFKAYVAALYLGEGIAVDSVLEDVPRRLEIEYFWAIPADGFARATVEGIRRNVAEPELDALRDGIDQINSLYQDVEPGDRYSLTYLPGVGTELALNGRAIGVVPGARLSQALFSIWLGDNPLDESLREQLLATP